MAARNLLRDAVLTGLLQSARLVGGLLLLPVLLHAMGAHNYGYVALGVSICTYSVMLESVLTPVLRNQINLAQARGQSEEVARLQRISFSAAAWVFGSALAIGAVILVAWGWGDKSDRPYLGLALACVFAIALASVGGVIDCLFSALDGLWLLRAWELTGTLVGFTSAAALAWSNCDPACVLAALVVLPHVPKLLAWVQQVRKGTIDANSDGAALLNFVRQNAHDSKNFLILQLLLCVVSTFPTFFVASQMGLVATTLWTTTQRVMMAPANFVVALMPVAWPRITRAHAAGRVDMLKRVFLIGLWLLVLLMSLWTAASLVWRESIFGLLTAGSLSPSVGLVFVAGALVVATTCGSWISSFLNALGEFGSQVRQSALTLVATVVLGPMGLWLSDLPGMVVGIFVALLIGAVPNGLKVWARLRVDEA